MLELVKLTLSNYEKTNCAIIGSGNIGTDLMLKIANTSKSLNLIGVIGIDPESEGLAMASTMNIRNFFNRLARIYGDA